VKVDVAIHQEGLPIAKCAQKAFDLTTQLQLNLAAKTCGAHTRQPLQPLRGEPSIELPPLIDQQIQFGGV